MTDFIIGIFGVTLGVLIPAGRLLIYIRDTRLGKKVIDGEVIGINEEEKTVRIRYKADNESFYEFDHNAFAAFISGRIPEPGLKVSVTVHEDDPYSPLSVLMLRASDRISRKPYMNSSNALNLIRLAALSAFLLSGGLIALFGDV